MTPKSLQQRRSLGARAPRWQRRKQSRPDEIIAAALACFIDKGFNATLLDEVAARAGIAKGTLYRYFESKEELFRAVVRANLVGEIAAAEREISTSELSCAELLSAFIQRMTARIATPAGALPHVVFAEAARFPDLARFYYDEVIARGLGLLELLIKRGMASGEFRRVDVRSAAFCIIAPVALEALFRHGLEPHARRGLGVDKLTPTLGKMSVEGLLKRNSK
jgi:AcrR family transcriptional regulator